MKSISKKLLLQCLILFVGLIIAHLGVTLYLLADLGADPFNVFVQGIFRTLARFLHFSWLTHGNTHIVLSLLIILILLFADKSYIKIGTLICMIFGGPIIDFFTVIFTPLFQTPHPLWIDILVEIIACFILAFGMTIVIKSEAGTGPNDLVAVVISDKSGKKFSIVRILVDVTFVAAGCLLGGSAGIGTLICTFLVGPIAGFFLPFNEKSIQKLLQKFLNSPA